LAHSANLIKLLLPTCAQGTATPFGPLSYTPLRAGRGTGIEGHGMREKPLADENNERTWSGRRKKKWKVIEGKGKEG